MNSKAAAAKEKKDQAKDLEKSKKAKAEEDAVWAAAGDGARTKAQSKKDDQVCSSFLMLDCCICESSKSKHRNQAGR